MCDKIVRGFSDRRVTCATKMDANVGFSDSVLLENETEAAFIGNLQLRFKRDLIFVSDLNFPLSPQKTIIKLNYRCRHTSDPT